LDYANPMNHSGDDNEGVRFELSPEMSFLRAT
jgi:hypothetical protein